MGKLNLSIKKITKPLKNFYEIVRIYNKKTKTKKDGLR